MKTITHDGKTQSLPAWARELGIPESTLRSRLGKLGMAPAQAFTRPVDARFQPTPAERVKVKPAPPMRKDARGRASARWTAGGRRKVKVFGPWGDPATVRAYNRWAAEWHAGQSAPAEPGAAVSVAGLALEHLTWAERHYRKNGKVTSEYHGIRAAVAVVNELYGDEPAAAFTATKLRAVQARWVTDGKALKTCNDYLGRVVRCWSWGVSRDLVPAAVADALKHVRPLVRGRTEAVVPDPITAAPDEHVERVLPLLHRDPDRCRTLAAILQLQRHTGMRPGEVLELRAEDLDRTREPWLYAPASGGKALHLDKDRRIWIGPNGRAVLAPFLASAEAGQPVFRLTRRRGNGLLPVRIEYLRACIAAACALAKVPLWTPNQVRHAKATEVQRRYEDDAAVAAALGNTPEVARQVYVDSPADAVAKRIAEELG